MGRETRRARRPGAARAVRRSRHHQATYRRRGRRARDAARPVPEDLRTALSTTGVFQDAIAGGYFRRSPDFIEAAKGLFFLLGSAEAETLFPFADDGAGNYFALRCEGSEGHVLFVDHDLGSAAPIGSSFAEWLRIEVEKVEARELRPNAEKRWCVQFGFRTRFPSRIFEVLSPSAEVDAPEGLRTIPSPPPRPGFWARVVRRRGTPALSPTPPWRFVQIHPASGVASFEVGFRLDGRELTLHGSSWCGWDRPSFCFDLDEPALTPPHESRIAAFDRAFRACADELGFVLVDYQIL